MKTRVAGAVIRSICHGANFLKRQSSCRAEPRMERLGNRDRTEAHRLSEREVSESNPAAQPSGNFTGCLPPPHKATARQADSARHDEAIFGVTYCPVEKTPRSIIHLDMDCFYAAIEVRDRPSLRGKPVAVGGARDRRGVLTTCNYEARKFGVHSRSEERRVGKEWRLGWWRSAE